MDRVKILQNLGDKFGLSIPVLGISTIMDQAACCYVVMTLEIGLQHGSCEMILMIGNIVLYSGFLLEKNIF